jgi:hypothetical protein
MKIFTMFLVLVALYGCKTIDTWDQGYPRSGSDLKTDTQKKDEFNKFAIALGKGGQSDDGYIQTQKDKIEDSDKYYSLGSFSPVLAKISPDAKKNYDELGENRTYHYIAVASLLGSIFLDPENSKDERRVYNALQIVGLGGLIGLGIWEANIFAELKNNYNNDLNRLIFDDKNSASSIRKNTILGLKLSTDF